MGEQNIQLLEQSGELAQVGREEEENGVSVL
jgi:hypothetical protein